LRSRPTWTINLAATDEDRPVTTAGAANSRHLFQQAVERGAAEALSELLSPDVVFHSPVVHAPFVGREVVVDLLSALLDTFEDPVYTDAFEADGKRALVFQAKLADLEAEGVQILRFDRDDLVADITVLLRPMRVAIALTEALGPRLEKLPDGTHRLKPA
jgi:SnoaL-like domain